jgi:mannose-6-phosphate isomerase class I
MGGNYPLLVKIIQANENLSIQVHPDDDSAKLLEGNDAVGKTECWYVLDALPDASLVYGLKKQYTKEQIKDAILNNTLEDFLNIGKIEINKSIEEVPAVKTILANIELAKTSLLATRFSAWGPSISASYSYGKAGTSASSDLRTTGNSLSLSLRLPLDGFLPWSNGALSIANQKANLQDLELQLKEKKESVALEIQNNIKNIEQAQAQLKVLESNVQLAQKRYNMTLTAYNHGSKDLLTLQNASDALMTARDNLSSQKIKIFSAILDLENTLGVPFGTLGKEEN